MFQALRQRGLRLFSSCSVQHAAEKLTRDQSKKNAQRALARRKLVAKRPPNKDPLYADISTAMRYIKAAEVGRPEKAATITITTNVVAEKGAAPLKGDISFPKPLKEVRILIFTDDPDQAQIAKDMGAALVGGLELIQQIKEGKVALDFNKAFATPDVQGQLGQVARILGPKGLMPNAKKGTISSDIAGLLKSNADTMPFKQKSNLLSIAVGKTSFTDAELLKNIIAATGAVRESLERLNTKKVPILGRTTISSTNGPAFVIDI